MISEKLEQFIASKIKDDKDICRSSMRIMIFIDNYLKFPYIKESSFDDPVFINYYKTSVYDEIESNLDSGFIRNKISEILRSEEKEIKYKSFQILNFISLNTNAGESKKILGDIELNKFMKAVEISNSGFNKFLEE